MKQIASNKFEQELLDKGYCFFKDNLRNSIKGIQKKFTDDKGIKYFITGYHYNHYKQGIYNAINEDSYMFTCQFRRDKESKDIAVNVDMWGEFINDKWRPLTTLDDVENFYEEVFIKMSFEYYELY